MSRRIGLVLRLAALALVPFAAGATEAPSVTRHVLPGGLRLLIREDPSAQVVAVSLQVAAGSRFETPATSGIGNFVQSPLDPAVVATWGSSSPGFMSRACARA